MPTTLTVPLEWSLAAETVLENLYDPLFKFDDKNGKFVPYLAKRWEQIDDLNIRIHLKKGINFHNGEQLDAEGVVKVMDLAIQEGGGATKKWLSRYFVEWKTSGKYSFDMKLKKPSFLWPNAFIRFGPAAPKHIYKIGLKKHTNNPIGSGLYKFSSWQRDTNVVLEYNKNHWENKNLKIKKLSFYNLPEAAVRVAGLESGDFDIAFNLPPEEVVRLKNKGFNISSGSAGQTQTVWLDPWGQTKELRDKRVRLALQYATNEELIWKTIAGGLGELPSGQMGVKGAIGYNPSLKRYGYDIEKAKKLLGEAGYPNGFTIKGSATTGRYYQDREVMLALKAQWSLVGVNLDLEFPESGAWLQGLINYKLNPVYNIGMTWYARSNAVSGPGSPSKASSYYNDMIKDINGTSNISEAIPKIQKAAKWVHDEAYGLFIFTMPLVHAYNDKAKGIIFKRNFGIDLTNVK